MSLGVMRQLPLLQTWLRQLLDKPLKGNKKVLEHLILLGLYQIAFSRVSSHAAVSETVNAASYLGGMQLKGLVNAILRNFERQALATQPVEDPIIASGLPKWFYKRVVAAYPDHYESVVEQTNAQAPIWLRVNTCQVSRETFCEALTQQDIAFSLSEQHPQAVILVKRQDITALPGYEKGWFAVQDGAAQLAAQYLAPQPNDRVLDCCAAPGGKTGHIFEIQPAIGSCLAIDSDAIRLERVKENMTRLQHKPEIKIGDALRPDQWWDGQLFDRILLDAPCSATGVIRRHPDIRWLRKSTDIAALGALQSEIMDVMWSLLKPGGTLLYATCSILPEENHQQVAAFLARTEDAELSSLTETDTTEKPGRQILPGEQQMDGFYYARLIKSSH